jgi:hypothetical protein
LAKAQRFPTQEIHPVTLNLAAKLTEELTQLLELPGELLRRLALAESLKTATLITLDPNISALPVAITLKNAPRSWPLLVALKLDLAGFGGFWPFGLNRSRGISGLDRLFAQREKSSFSSKMAKQSLRKLYR